jgi:hypothetical protein
MLLSAVTTYSPIDKVRIGELEVKLVWLWTYRNKYIGYN